MKFLGLQNRKKINNFGLNKWYHFTEGLVFPYYILILSIGGISGSFAEINFDDWLIYFAILAIVSIITMGASLAKLGKNDYRLWLTFHLVIIVQIVASAAMIVTNASFNGFEFTIGTIVPVIFVVFILISAVFSIFNLSERYLVGFQALKDRVEQNDLSARIESKEVLSDSVFGPIAQMVNDMLNYLVTIIETVQLSVTRLGSSSEELLATSEEVNALTEEIAATIQQISRGASDQSRLAIGGIESINDMSNVIDQSLKDIETTLRIIEEIAGQTNILALNAAIEAARAGEYGRGFAVVSDNVRRLAEETKNNAEGISNLTENIVSGIGSRIKQLQETLQSFGSQSEEFSASSEQVAAATEEQTASMNQLTNSALELTKLSDSLGLLVNQYSIQEKVKFSS